MSTPSHSPTTTESSASSSSSSSSSHNVTFCVAPRTGDILPYQCNSTLGFDACAPPAVPKTLPTDTCHNASLTLPNVAALYKSFVLYNRNCTAVADPSPDHAASLPHSDTRLRRRVRHRRLPRLQRQPRTPSRPATTRSPRSPVSPLSTCHPHQCCALPGTGLVLNGTAASTAIVAPYFALTQIAAPDDTFAFIIIGACVGACCFIGCLVAFYAFVVKRKQRAAVAANKSARGRSLVPATSSSVNGGDEREALFAQLPDETGVPGIVAVPLRHKTAPNF
jgi:hypothetical protein